MTAQIEVAWVCRPCKVGGRDVPSSPQSPPSCWNCGGPVVVTARPTVKEGVS